MRLSFLPVAGAAVLILYGCASPWSGPRYSEYPPGYYRTARPPPPGYKTGAANEKGKKYSDWNGGAESKPQSSAVKAAHGSEPRERPEETAGKSGSAKAANANPKKPAESKVASIEEEKAAAPVAGRPVTPAQIRAAVPLAKVANPRKALASAQVKTLYGDVLGKVHSVDVGGGGAVKSIEVDIGNKTVRLDAAKLKYVRSRNLLVTGMSKMEVEKLPAAKS